MNDSPVGPPVIEVKGLCVDFWNQNRWANILNDVSFEVRLGDALGLVGESGSGKTTTAYTLLGYRRPNSRITGGQALFHGQDLLSLNAKELQSLRGRRIGFVPQDPTTALSPGMSVGRQIVEMLLEHGTSRTGSEAREKTLELFGMVNLPDPATIFQRYPHQLSGGQQQRVVITMALACRPELVVMDEPTTGLDVTTQAQILALLKDLRQRFRMAIVYVTHNLGVVAQICNRIGVMYAGRLVEVAPTRDLYAHPRHPYTQGLMAAVPRLDREGQLVLMNGLLRRSELPAGCQFAPRCRFAEAKCFTQPQPLARLGLQHEVACRRWAEIPAFHERLSREPKPAPVPAASQREAAARPLLTVDTLRAGYGFERKGWSLRRTPRITVDGVSFDLRPGQTLALVGESGSGKTTIARALSGLLPHVSGRLLLAEGQDVGRPASQRPLEILRSVQLIFQNPDASLNPRQRVGDILGRPLRRFFSLPPRSVRARIEQLLGDVHLDPSYDRRFPDELSGGERQRVAIARALAAEPSVLLCDEIVSALDVSVQANILKLLREVQAKRGIALLFISHDLAVVRSLAHAVAVLYWGSLCEIGTVEEVFERPSHPYTVLLLRSIPEADPEHVMPAVKAEAGLVPGSASQTACPFAPRCPWTLGSICEKVTPPWRQVTATHRIRCHLPLEDLCKA